MRCALRRWTSPRFLRAGDEGRRARIRFSLFLCATDLAFIPLDLLGWAHGAHRWLAIAGRLGLAALLGGGALLLSRLQDGRTWKLSLRAMSVVGIVCLGAVAWGTGGSASPQFALLSVSPIIFTALMPRDPVASALVSAVTLSLAVAQLAFERASLYHATLWLSSFACTGAFAIVGTVLYGRMHQRETRARQALAERTRQHSIEGREREALTAELDVLRRYVHDILLLVGMDGTILAANARAVAAYGYEEAALRKMGTRALGALEAGGRDITDFLQVLRESGTRFTTVHRRRDGSTFPVEVSTIPLERDGQRLVQCVIRDRSAELAARAAIDHRAMLLDNLFDAVIGLDRESRVNAWNPAAEQLFGWSASEAMGRDLSTLLPTDYGTPFEGVRARVDRGEQVKLEVRRRTRTEEWVDVEMTAGALRGPGGGVVGYVSVNRDISIAARAKAALRQNEERFRQILEASGEGVWVLDTEGRTEYVNARCCELFGLDEGQVVGRPVLEVLPAVDRNVLRSDLVALAAGREFQRDQKVESPDGTEKWLVVSGSPLRERDGRLTGSVRVFTDVTAHRRAQEQFLQSQKMEAVGRLASGVAHDFNNLLVVILSNSSFLVDAFPEGDLRREDAQQIRDAGQRAQRLVRQLLAFGRRGTARPMPVEVNGVVEGFEKLLRRTIGEDVEVRLSLTPEAWCSRIDPGHLEQLLMNLAVNARDAMPTGGKLRIETENALLDRPPEGCEMLATGRYVILRVADTGHGMPPEVRARIFEPFFTTKERGQGTGLGLATVYGIVQQAKGAITVDTSPGHGSTFTVFLPACDVACDDEAEAPEAQKARGRGETVLVAEDEDGVREVARRILERGGYRVLDARDGAEALRLFEAQEVDVVLSDVVMPGMSAFDLVATISKRDPTIPVVFMSGYADRQVGDRPLLRKPFTEPELLAIVQEALAIRRAGRRIDAA